MASKEKLIDFSKSTNDMNKITTINVGGISLNNIDIEYDGANLI